MGKWQSIGCLSFVLSLSTIAPILTPLEVHAQTAAQGYTLLEKGWVNDAIAAFEAALKRNPNDREAEVGVAIAYQKAGRDLEAWNAYNRVLAQDSKNRRALIGVATMGSYRPDWQARGIDALDILLSLEPGNSEMRAQRALLLGYQGRFSDAIADYEQLLSGNPAPAIVLQAAQVYSYSGLYPESVSLFGRYVQVAKPDTRLPDDAAVAYAKALYETGNALAAIPVITAQLNPKTEPRPEAELKSILAMAYAATNQPAQAREILQELRQAPSSLPLARALTTIGRQQKDPALYQEGVEIYQTLWKGESNPSMGLQLEVADVLSELASTRPQALSLYESLRRRQPNNRAVAIKSIALALKLKEISPAEAATQLKPLVEPLPDSASDRALLAQSLMGVDPPAADLLTSYQALQELAPMLNLRIAQILQQSGDRPGAIAALNVYRSTPQGRQDTGAELLAADLERSSGTLEASAERYQDLLEKSPDNVDYLKALAGIRFEQKRYKEAAALYDRILALNPNDLEIYRIVADLNLAQDHPFTAFQNLRSIQRQQSTPDPMIKNRIQYIEIETLKRRGFQPGWEGY